MPHRSLCIVFEFQSQTNLDDGDYFSEDNLDDDVLGFIKEFDSDDDSDVEVVHEAVDDNDIVMAALDDDDDDDDDAVLIGRQKGILGKFEGKESPRCQLVIVMIIHPSLTRMIMIFTLHQRNRKRRKLELQLSKLMKLSLKSKRRK